MEIIGKYQYIELSLSKKNHKNHRSPPFGPRFSGLGFRVVEIQGRRFSGSSIFGVVEFQGCRVLGSSRFGVVEIWGRRF